MCIFKCFFSITNSFFNVILSNVTEFGTEKLFNNAVLHTSYLSLIVVTAYCKQKGKK
jgi:hypothetical protein